VNRLNSKIVVVDAVMGQGKTSWAIQMMRERPHERFLYVTPYLDECERVVSACCPDRFCQPHDNDGLTKLDDLKAKMAEGKCIATTHELFKRIDREVLELVADHGYILVLDEVVDVIRPLTAPDAKTVVSEEDEERTNADWIRALIEHDILRVGESLGNGQAQRLLPGEETRLGLWSYQKYAEEGRLVMVNGAMLVWLFPADCFSSFKEVYNLTFLFDGQAQKAYLDIHGLTYDLKSVVKAGDRYELVEWDPDLDGAIIEKARELISIYEGPANNIGWKTGRSQPLSKNWYLRNRKLGRQVMQATKDWLRRRARATASEAIWTVFKPIYNEGRNAPAGYKKSWLSTTTRATNEYRERRAVAYLVNVFFRTPVARYLYTMGIQLDEDLFALSEMVQFIWRSRIREGKPIDVYIPSSRMRHLLKGWLEQSPVSTGIPEAEAA
jgi:hypothetical protein